MTSEQRHPETHSRSTVRDSLDLSWYYLDAEGEIARMKSTFPDEAATKAAKIGEPLGFEVFPDGRRAEKSGMWCGAIEVKSPKPAVLHHELPMASLYAAARERRIRTALRRAGAAAELALQLRFREPLPHCREPFGSAAGAERMAHVPDAASGAYRLAPFRGAGNLAHLTAAARAAWESQRTTLTLTRWVDRLGNRVQNLRSSPEEAAWRRAIREECSRMEASALGAYRRGQSRVPDRVYRAALARAA